ncbi:MAG: hypothetical protein ACJ73J_05690, partial [Actinomycetes bacterium]
LPPGISDDVGQPSQSPSQWWPQDRMWCVASEIDFDSTLVGGPADLITEITHHPKLEAYRVESGDDLTARGDLINSPVSG